MDPEWEELGAVATIFAKACVVSGGAGPDGFSPLPALVARSEAVLGEAGFAERAKGGRARRPGLSLLLVARPLPNPYLNIQRRAFFAIDQDRLSR
jgi:hypothetical protein